MNNSITKMIARVRADDAFWKAMAEALARLLEDEHANEQAGSGNNHTLSVNGTLATSKNYFMYQRR